MKEVLFVAYDSLPLTSPGSIRLSKLTRYLPENGWRPIVLTGRGTYSLYDSSPQRFSPGVVVERTSDFDPFKSVAAATRGRGSSTGGSLAPLTSLLRRAHSLVLPDRDWFWLIPALRTGRRILAERKVEAIFSTSPYITNHLVALRLKRISGLPWIAEFRDPWA